MRKLIMLLSAIGTSASFGAEALAAEIPAEGQIDSTFTYISTSTDMPSADGNEVTSFDAHLVLTGNAKGSLFDQMVGHCMLAGLSNPKTGAVKLAGWCTYTDLEGDMIFAGDEESADSSASIAQGKGRILGGTGKYAGIAGEYSFTDEYFGSPEEGVYGGAGKKSGTYKISK